MQTFSKEIVTRNSFFSQQIWYKSLLTRISTNITFRAVFDFNKLKIYCWDYFLLWLQASPFLKYALPTRNELYWEQILTRPFHLMPRIVECNSITWSSSLNFWAVAWKQWSQKNNKGVFWENINFLSNLYEIQIQVNKKLIV